MSIVDNKKAFHDYFIEERFEAGMVLEGWEVKAVRAGKVQLTDGYVVVKNGELFIIGCQINPLGTASTHVRPDAVRTRKLLMHKDEIRRLMWHCVGIVRSDHRLTLAHARITSIREELDRYYWNTQVTDALLEVRNLALVAALTIQCAMGRKESRGIHYTLDYPETDDEYGAKDTILR